MSSSQQFTRCQFISAEINHDFNKKNPRLNENLDNCWDINTICQSNLITPKTRSRGSTGDDQLVSQIFKTTKDELKKLVPGKKYDIYPLAGPGINLSLPLNSQQEANFAIYPDQNEVSKGCKMYIAHPSSNSRNLTDIYNIFEYPDENFLIIDAVPNFVTSILKQLIFPTVVDSQTGMAGSFPGHGVGNQVISFDPNNFTNFDINELNKNPNFALDSNGQRMWPFRPKINVINSPTTLGDPSPTADPGAPSFSIDKRLPPSTLNSNTCFIPGGVQAELNACPLIFTWYYNNKQISLPRNPLMMSAYEIVMQPSNPPQAWRMRQDWTGGMEPLRGDSVPNAAKENAVPALKKYMITNGIVPSDGNDSNSITNDQRAVASFLVQRKRSGDYLQIETAYEFPALAAKSANDNSTYSLVLGPFNSNKNATLAGSGNLKTGQPILTRNTQWYRNRTYFVTGDWPAFCYATYNRINCILICKRKSCSGSQNTSIIFRNYFG